MIYGITILQQIADKLAIQAGRNEGDIAIILIINDNNSAMLDYFLRMARLAKIDVVLKRLDIDNNKAVDELEPMLNL